MTATSEPECPENWPFSNVDVSQTGRGTEECISVVIHGVEHHLHSTTAMALCVMLGEELVAWNKTARAMGAPGVDKAEIRQLIHERRAQQNADEEVYVEDLLGSGLRKARAEALVKKAGVRMIHGRRPE